MLEYRVATINDIDLLVNLRLDFLTELSGVQSSDVTEQLCTSLNVYFQSALANGQYVCWLVFDNETVAGVGGMACWQKPGSFNNPGGRVGYIMNMYTVPMYRKRGICSELLKRLEADARGAGIAVLEMHATAEGEPLYRKRHFREPANCVLELNLFTGHYV